MTYHNSTLSADHIQHISSIALQQGGFSEFYQAQVRLFVEHVEPSFNYLKFRLKTQRATQPLTDAIDLLCYNVCYAAEHFACFSHVLDKVQTRSAVRPQQKISLKVFDFACGQGLASLALLQHLQDRPADIEIHLVEPSVVALHAAQHYVSILAQKINGSVSIHAHACELDQLSREMRRQQPEQRMLFLCSNVLDMTQHERFNIAKLACFMRGAIDPALCIAVSPHFISGERGFELIQDHLPIYRTPVDEVFHVNTLTYRLGQGLQMRSCTGRALACLFDIEATLCDSPDDELTENSSSIISAEMLACI